MPRRIGLGQLPGLLRNRRARPLLRPFSRMFTRIDRHLARSGRSTIGGWVAGGLPVMLMTTKGRHSGQPHVTPLIYHRDQDGSLLVIAANGAADWNPDWFHNLVADPNVEVEVDGVRHAAHATMLAGSQRSVAWPRALQVFPGLQTAQAKSTREIPLVRVTVR